MEFYNKKIPPKEGILKLQVRSGPPKLGLTKGKKNCQGKMND
jgi:hypothetical protein